MIWMHISSGRGPEECAWVVARVLSHLKACAKNHGLTVRILESVRGHTRETLKSAWIALDGDGAETFAEKWEGTVQWIGQSMFRPGHKRKNWYVGVRILKPVKQEMVQGASYNIETMRSSGPGGQHANKTESSVRITHVPTGLSATAQEERSQHLNKKLAMARLEDLLKQRETKEQRKTLQTLWTFHNTLERGNPVKVFKGKRFKEE